MERKPLVSVIVPFFNAARFLRGAIESVFAQTYGSWELLFVDDGSNDESREMARARERAHPNKVRYIDHAGHQNRGLPASRNLGITHTRGDYVAFLDSDDVWMPRKLEEQIRLMHAHAEAGMVYGPSLRWFSWTGKPEDMARDYLPQLGVEPNRVIDPPALLAMSIERKATTPCPSNVLLRRSTFDRVGLFEESFSGSRQLYEDQVFFAKVTSQIPVYVSDSRWDYYRRHPDSIASVVKGKGEAFHVRGVYLRWLEGYLAERCIENDTLRQALGRQLWPYRHPVRYRISRAAKKLLASYSKLAPTIAESRS